ncbi:YusG family protein [Metabacillus halosaccharovorans]|uniref:YusG family protein n=1 Tax=Metabacillus halosaccharovorans TaxID=930124 RepID=UPI00203CD5ED|nr:YusG family protein [Metabacillus halosaccharovorans]MCM3440007.1 YusG family protein [Metabacillus halosaccharovorans]
MSIQKQRLDITDRVVGKFGDGQLNLYLENEKIGQMVSENNYNLKAGYEFSNSHFYQIADVLSGPDQKYVDCDDENGWC